MLIKKKKGKLIDNISILMENVTQNSDVFAQMLYRASYKYYERLTSSNGRFSYFECNDKLFPSARPIQTKYVGGNSVIIKNISKFYLEKGHLLLVGEGGIGKTTSLLKAWKDLLDNYNELSIIPVYIPLNEVNIFGGSDFVADYISNAYGVDSFQAQNLHNVTIMLLLDGFNEISDRNNRIEISKEIKQLCNKNNIRVIMTSRFNFIHSYGFENIQKYDILPLDDEIVKEYLLEEGITHVDIPLSIIANPMMLTLFTNMCHIKEKISYMIVLPFVNSKTKGELISNFMFCQIGKGFSIANAENTYLTYIALLLVSPYVAHAIECAGQFSFDYSTIRDVVMNALIYYSDEDYQFFFNRDLVSLFAATPYKLRRDENLVTAVVKILIEDLAILQNDGVNLSFRHQYFRDFFSAWFVVNDTERSLQKGIIPSSLADRTLPEYIAEFVGDCVHESDPKIHSNKKSFINTLLAFARNKTSLEVSLMVNNVINILNISRQGNLSEVDFSCIDLTKVSLNGLIFSHKSRCADFGKSRISSRTFLLQGHLGQVRSAIYNKDSTIILSAGDTSVKEWDSLTGLCVANYIGHSNLVNTACFHPDETKILSAANDNTAREWDRSSGKCLHIFNDHKGYVTKAIYDATGNAVFTCSWDGCVFRYDRVGDSWNGPKLVAHHEMNIKSIALSRDGLYILTASGDTTIKEWDMHCNVINVYEGHTDMVNSAVYSPSDRYILSGSYDKSIRIVERCSNREIWSNNGTGFWIRNVCFNDMEDAFFAAVHNGEVWEFGFSRTGDCPLLNKYIGHTKAVTNISLSGDESRLLTTSEDGTIREWDRNSKQCIRIYNGIEFSTTETVYSDDGMSVLTIRDKTFSIAKRTDGIAYFNSPQYGSVVTSAVFANGNKSVLYTNAEGLFLLDIATGQTECIVQSQKEKCALTYVKFDPTQNRILALGHNNDNLSVVFYVTSDYKVLSHILPIRAEYADFKSDSEFVTFSFGGIIRIWDLNIGVQKGVLGVNVRNCSFSKCEFEDLSIKEVIKESGGLIIE